MAEVFLGLTGFRRIVDDIVIYDSDATHMPTMFGVQTNKLHSTHFSHTQATFAGFQLSSNGYQVDSSITEDISIFPTPTNQPNRSLVLFWVSQPAVCFH